MKTHRISARIPFLAISAGLLLGLMISLGVPTAARAADAAAIPLPADVAKDLEPLGKGVVGKALPAPPISDIHELWNAGSGQWEYQIVQGGKEGKKVRTEQYEKLPDKDGAEAWKRSIGTEFVEYMSVDAKGDIKKYLEDDVELGYTSRFVPAITWLGNAKAGATRTIESKVEAFKTAKPDKVSYSGKLKAHLTYVGRYEVTTPAGTWPAALIRTEFDIKVGPAKVTDTAYLFFAKGVGKVAEIEATHVSALLIYHSSTTIAKVLTKYPKR